MAALQITSILQESQTYDEAVHLTAGYRYWLTGHFQMNGEHPPLQKLLSALPLLALRPKLPTDPKLDGDQYEYARAFLYKGSENAGRMLFLARLVTILLTLVLGALVAVTARKYFGPAAGLLAVGLFALDPNFIAHGRYVTTDLIAALMYFATVVGWMRYLEKPTARRALYAGLLLGLALGSKFSLVLLVPLLPCLWLLHRWLVAGDWRQGARAFGIAIGTAALVVALLYATETWRTIRGRNRDARPIRIAGMTLPPHTFFTGLHAVLEHNDSGHPAFLLGESSDKGWWYYFPVAFGVKSPTALLFGTVLAAGIALARWRQWRKPGSFVCWALVIPPLLYFGLSMASHINIGIRHLLPVYPFLYVMLAAAVLRGLPAIPGLVLAVALLLAQAGEAANIHPDHLTFFNTLAGGPQAGPRYLLDSNLDWGQDLKKLKVFMDDNHLRSLCLDYFGYATPSYYGIKDEYLPKTWDKDEMERMDCIGAISVTLLYDLYIRKGSYEWLRRRVPLGTVGNSIYLYDLRRRR